MINKKIIVVIPFYNGRGYIPDCFDSLTKQTVLPEKIIVIDNNSTDGSQEDLKKIEQNNSLVKVTYNQNNLGFVGGCNQGMELAMKDNIDYIFLLNQDTICASNCLEELLAVAERNNNWFAIQSLLLCWPQKDLIQTAGDRIHFLGFGYSGEFKKPLNLFGDLKQKSITYCSGAAMFLNVPALKKIGIFDKDLFMYHDDLDLCWRARLQGYDILLAPQSIVYHKYTEGVVKSRWYWSERNRTLTLLKFYKWPTLLLIFLPWLIMEIGVLSYALLTGWFGLKIKSIFSAIGMIPITIRKRIILQRQRLASDRAIVKILDGRFNYAALKNPILQFIINPIFSLYWWLLKKIIFW